MKKFSFLWLCLLLCSFNVSTLTAQGRLGINTDGSTPDASALLDLKSSTQGLLVPRMLSSERTTITSPATGLLVYQTDGVSPGFYYYDGTAWLNLRALGPFGTTTNITRNENGIYAADDFVFGSPVLDYDSDIDHHNRFLFDKSKGAFRAGQANSTAWDNANIGDGSIGLGINAIASGPGAISIGGSTTASGTYAVAMGSSCTATQSFATAFGAGNNATNFYAVAFGQSNVASGSNSTAFGSANNASGNYSTTFGRLNNASGNNSIAIGTNTNALSFGEVVVGIANSTYTPQSTTAANDADRLFVVGNGLPGFFGPKSDALIIYKDGSISFDEFSTTPATTTDRLYNLNGDLYFDGVQLDKDDMGDHTATQVVNLNGQYLSGDTDAEGIYIDLSGNVSLTGEILQDAPTNPTFQNAWMDFGSGYEPASFYKDKSGRVHLSGTIHAGAPGMAAFTLPSGLEPTAQRAFHAISYDGADTVLGRIDIMPTGEVIVEVYGGVWISLDGISF